MFLVVRQEGSVRLCNSPLYETNVGDLGKVSRYGQGSQTFYLNNDLRTATLRQPQVVSIFASNSLQGSRVVAADLRFPCCVSGSLRKLLRIFPIGSGNLRANGGLLRGEGLSGFLLNGCQGEGQTYPSSHRRVGRSLIVQGGRGSLFF